MDLLNFFLADVQSGVGPFLAIYLAGYHWNEQRVGLALTVGGIAGICAQTPAGAMVDRMRSKRAIIAVSVIALAIGALVIAVWPALIPVLAAQVLIGSASSVFIPVICAISLGIVGQKAFDRRQGRNQAFNSAGNVTAAVAMGLIGYYLSNCGIFFFVIALALPTIASLRLINPKEIDYDLARNASAGKDERKPQSVFVLLKEKPLLIFLCSAVLFHFANAAMLPLLGEMLAKGKGRSSMVFMSACVVTTQLIITLIASPVGRLASLWGRKTLLLIAFSALPIRGVLYTLTSSTPMLIAIQTLDGIGAGIFGVVSVLVIADLTRGSGRFNLAQGAIATAVGIGSSLSQLIAGAIVHHAGYNTCFLILAGIAAVAVAILLTSMPETLRKQS